MEPNFSYAFTAFRKDPVPPLPQTGRMWLRRVMRKKVVILCLTAVIASSSLLGVICTATNHCDLETGYVKLEESNS